MYIAHLVPRRDLKTWLNFMRFVYSMHFCFDWLAAFCHFIPDGNKIAFIYIYTYIFLFP